MSAEEVLVFRGFDSEAAEHVSVLHTAFDDPTVTDGAVPRGSVESRFIALYD